MNSMGKSFRSPTKIMRRLKLAPLVSRSLTNWPRFLYNYSLGLVPDSAYTFRNGARVKIGRGVDHVPIIEIFLRQDYGIIPEGATILDFGANIGIFAIYAATTARNVKIYAYEPQPTFFRLMQENVHLNNLDACISCFNVAIAGRTSDRELFQPNTTFFFPTLVPPDRAEACTSTRVSCTTLSEVLTANDLTSVDLLKMDTEGAEYETLYETPVDQLRRIREIRMEYHNLDSQRRNVGELKRFLTANGFAVMHEQATNQVSGNLWAQRYD